MRSNGWDRTPFGGIYLYPGIWDKPKLESAAQPTGSSSWKDNLEGKSMLIPQDAVNGELVRDGASAERLEDTKKDMTKVVYRVRKEASKTPGG